MEHLLFNGDNVAPVSIPYLGSEFDGGDFFTFPDRQGWDVSSWEYVEPEESEFDMNGRSLEEMAAFLQTWLFFGLLSAFLGDKCSPNDFIRTDEAGNKFITTKMLDRYLEEWRQRIKGLMTEDEIETQGDLLESYLMKARTVNNTLNFVLFYESQPSKSEPLRQTLFAQMLLLEALYGATVEVLKIQPFKDNLFHDTYLRRHLILSGWCTTTVEYMQSKLPLQLQAYALAVGSTRTRLDHTECTRYDPGGCKKSQMGPDFKQQHVTSGCQCPQLSVPIDQLVEILREGLIPVVTIKRSDSSVHPMELLVDGLDLDHSSFESFGAPYFAFSHVWSDGLGNESSNALYQCQLERLDRMLQSLEGDQVTIAKSFDTTAGDLGTVAFWLDTLCIPVQKEHIALRHYSIQSMNKIYRKASGTIVIDPDIQALPSDAKLVQVLTRALCSSWRGRMWTYEEAALASQVYLPIDGACHLFHSEEEVFESPTAPTSLVELQLLRLCWERYCDLVWDNLASFCISRKPARAFVRMATAASNRNTTRKGDETVCFATFLGLDATDLVKAPVNDRMPVLLSLLPAIPPEILFAYGPHLEQKGYRWAPKTFLSPFGLREHLRIVMPKEYTPSDGPSPDGSFPVPQPFIHTDSLGLGVFLSGIQFQRGLSVTAPLLFSIATQNQGTYVVEAMDSGSQVPWMLEDPNSETETFAVLLTDTEYSSVGLLVKVTGETGDGKLLCKWGSIVEITSNEEEKGSWISLAENASFQGVRVPFQWWVVD
ncbi:hypothetical protein BFW01_g1975 [Lasiodiplodia theobromae]|nr:hypothetical protein BFW01_g1975 [Lasiodiplodia theobromae]